MVALRRALALMAVAFLAAVPARAAEVDKFLPDDAVFVASINVKQIVESPLFKQYGQEKLREKLKSEDEATRVLEALGFDPFKDLTSITVAGTSIAHDSKPFIIAHGKFDTARFAAKAEDVAKNQGDILKVHKEGGHTIYEVNPPGVPEPLFVGLVDGGTILASHDKEFVVQGYARAGKNESNVKKEIRDLIEKVDPKLSMWFVVPGSVLSQSDLGKQEEAKKILDKTDSISGGLALDKDLKFSITLGAGSADNAKQLATSLKEPLEMLKNFAQLGAANEPKLAPLVNLANGLKITTSGTSVTIAAEVSEDLVKEGLTMDQ